MKIVLVIDPAVSEPESQGESVLEALADRPSKVIRPALDPNGEWPPPEKCEAIVVMGSAASVHDDFAWLERLRAWLEPVVNGDAQVPLFGICFGHQLIHHMAGGEVGFRRPSRDKLVGVYTSTLVESPVFGAPRTVRVICSHREEVTKIGDGFEVVGARPTCANDVAVSQDRPIGTVQFHPEARTDFARRVGIALQELDREMIDTSNGVIENFFRFAKKWNTANS